MSLSNSYLELCLNNCLILFFIKFGFTYENYTHFLPEEKLVEFLGYNSVKEFYLVTTKRKDKWYFLRPELTYASLLYSINLQSSMYCYSGFCFRNERKQFCRFKEFLQFGIEAVFSNDKKIRYVFYYMLFLSYFFLKTFVISSCLKDFVVLDIFYSNDDQKLELQEILKICNDFLQLSCLNILPISRQGNSVTPYCGMAFEYHIKHDANGIHKEKKMYEFLGGGEYIYSYRNCFGVGFASGLQRLMLCNIDFKKILDFISNHFIDKNFKKVIFNLNHDNKQKFVMNLIDFFKNIDIDMLDNINIEFSKKYNFDWKFSDQTSLI